jgi:hypothetical protein
VHLWGRVQLRASIGCSTWRRLWGDGCSTPLPRSGFRISSLGAGIFAILFESGHFFSRRQVKVRRVATSSLKHGIATVTSLEASGRGGAGVGIAGMSERIEELGGRFEVTSNDRGKTGTTVRVRLPLMKDPG